MTDDDIERQIDRIIENAKKQNEAAAKLQNSQANNQESSQVKTPDPAAADDEPLEIDAAVDKEPDSLTEQYAKANNETTDEEKKDNQGKEGETDGKKDKFKEKFRLKIERFSRLIADGEKFAYDKLKAPYRPEYYDETKDDIDIIIQNRLTLVSEYGDILNLAFDLVGHAVSSGLEMREQTNTKTDQENKNPGTGARPKWF